MPKWAELVTLDLSQKTLYIDGEEFPYRITEDGPTLENLTAGDPASLRKVTVTILADNVQVIPLRRIQIDLTGRRPDGLIPVDNRDLGLKLYEFISVHDPVYGYSADAQVHIIDPDQTAYVATYQRSVRCEPVEVPPSN